MIGMTRYIMYLILSSLGGSIFVKLGLTKDELVGSVFCLLCGILGELLDWKYQPVKEKEQNVD